MESETISTPANETHHPSLPQRLSHLLAGKRTHWALFASILVLGVFARVWQFRTLPPGLNTDEASIGLEAYDLYHYGLDRNGVSFPVHFISFGSGQNALYGYLLIPFVALLGLSPAVVRLPMMITGILSLPLMFVVGRLIRDTRFGLLSMFFLAISPWHILLSRLGLDSNLLPFVLLSAFTCLLLALRRPRYFIAGSILCALAPYAYGAAYAMMPIFMALVLVIFLRARIVRFRYLATGLVAFAVVAAPIAAFILVNALGVNSLRLGPVTVPRLPVETRYESQTALIRAAPLAGLLENSFTMLKVLVVQSDGILYNAMSPYGYFYTLTFPLAVVGIVLLIREKNDSTKWPRYLLLAWISSALPVGLLQASNINRLNSLFIPLILCIALCVDRLSGTGYRLQPAWIAVFLAAFMGFSLAYHGSAYAASAKAKFHQGLLSALQFSEQGATATICVTDEINMPYIFALFSEKPDPKVFLSTVEYVDPSQPLRQVRSYGRYIFGTQNCSMAARPIYILMVEEIPPRLGNRYDFKFFDNYVVYFPKP